MGMAYKGKSAKRYHQTLTLMGATRLASGKYAAII